MKMGAAGNTSYFELQKDSPYLAREGKLGLSIMSITEKTSML